MSERELENYSGFIAGLIFALSNASTIFFLLFMETVVVLIGFVAAGLIVAIYSFVSEVRYRNAQRIT